MPVAKITKVGSIGIMPDTEDHEIPAGDTQFGWSYAQNIRTDKGEIASSKGYVSSTTPTGTPEYINTAVTASGDFRWIYMTDTKAYGYDGTTHTEITNIGGDYNTTVDAIWSGCTFSGYPIVNNGANLPQYWLPIDMAQPLQDLIGWDAGHACGDIQAYKNFLVAFDIIKSGTRYPNMVKWSSAADAGGLPASWDETDPTLLAGEAELVETTGAVITSCPLRGQNIVYKENSTYLMNYIGGQFVFSFSLLYPNSGILGKRCVTEFEGKHFVVTTDDVVIHDGQAPVKSIADRKVRDLLFKGISFDQRRKVFVTQIRAENEIWVVFPEEGKLYCNKALVWNTNDGSWAIRDVPNINHMTEAVLTIQETGDLSWNDISQGWYANDEGWSERLFNPIVKAAIACGQNDLYQMDTTNQSDGADRIVYIERVGVDVGGNDRVEMISAIYPRMTGDPVKIFIGSQENTSSAVKWEGGYDFTPTVDYKVDCRVTGRLHSIRIESTNDASWRLQGFDIEYQDRGMR